MRIVICGANFSPEQIGIGKYTGEMAAWLAAKGHEVRVVAAPPHYPEWKIRNPYSGLRYKTEKKWGMTVFRCPIWVPAAPSGIKRIFCLLGFALSAFPVLLRQILWKPGVILTVEPPLFCAPAVLFVARLCGAKSWLHVQDFEVDAAFNLGILPEGRIRTLVQFLEKQLMKRFSRVSTIAPMMLDRLKSKGVSQGNALCFPNWVDTRSIFPLDTSPMKEELGFSKDETICLYSGNMGEKQGLEILIDVARSLKEQSLIRFVLCGDGAIRGRLFEAGKDLPNIHWLPLQPMEKLNDLLNMADIHLLPQKADVADLVMPSKLTGILASGRPVVATSRKGTRVAEVVEGKGIAVVPGDVDAFADAIRMLAADASLRREMGAAGRDYAVGSLSKEAILSRFEKELVDLVSQRFCI